MKTKKNSDTPYILFVKKGGNAYLPTHCLYLIVRFGQTKLYFFIVASALCIYFVIDLLISYSGSFKCKIASDCYKHKPSAT